MPAIDLSSYKPVAGALGDAAPIGSAFDTIQAAVNALDANNFAAGKIFALTKLQQGGATTGQGLTWNATDWVPTSEVPQKLTWAGLPILGGEASATWETANAAILVPFTVSKTQTLTAVLISSGTVNSGNYDVGVYTAAGAKVATKGSTAQSTLGTSAVSAVSLGSPSLTPGQYYLALVADNATGQFWLTTVANTPARLLELKVLTAFPLPPSLTPGSTAPTKGLPLACTLT